MNAKKLLESFIVDPSTYYKTRKWVDCPPFPQQSPGVGGLVRPVWEMQTEHYVEMWTESVLAHIGPKQLQGSTWVVSGGPRFQFQEIFFRVVSVLASHPVKKILLARNGMVTSAAMSLLVLKEQALAGIYITAIFKDAGPDGYQGLNLIVSKGCSASAMLMSTIFGESSSLTGYHFVPEFTFPIDQHASYGFKVNSNYIEVEICDAIRRYADYMETIFDFPKLTRLIEGKGGFPRTLKILVDTMNAGGGPYAKEVFEGRLGCSSGTILNEPPSDSYPSLVMKSSNRPQLVNKMRMERWDAGFALDETAERMMVIGMKGYRVSPGVSAAIIAAHLHCIPYFQMRGVLGLARSFALDPSIDKVASDLGIRLIKTPVGVEVMFNLIHAGLVSVISDESCGFGTPHLGEKDGIWAILAWLSIFAHLNVPIYEIVMQHWMKYGKYFSVRVDLEVDELLGLGIMAAMERQCTRPSRYGSVYGTEPHSYTLLGAENYSYICSYDDTIIEKCGLIIYFEGGSKIIFRLSTTVKGTLRIYLHHFTNDPRQYLCNRIEMLRPLLSISHDLLDISDIDYQKFKYTIC